MSAPTSRHDVRTSWVRGDQDFLAGHYSRAHTLTFDGGAVVAGSASPSVVRLPWSDPSAVDPEELLVASLSSCHMLWFLDFARHAGVDVLSYLDEASGELGEDAQGRVVMQAVTLRPRIATAPPAATPAVIEALHEKAHAACFIANSVKSDVRIEPVYADARNG
jgi:organic hydroperoxide reductase OsmC/OhrA